MRKYLPALILRLVIMVAVTLLIPTAWLGHVLAPLLGVDELPLQLTLLILLPFAWGWYAEDIMDWMRLPAWRRG